MRTLKESSWGERKVSSLADTTPAMGVHRPSEEGYVSSSCHNKYHRQCGLNNRNLSPHSSGAQKSKVSLLG